MLERTELEMPTFAQWSMSGQQDIDPREDLRATVTRWDLPHLIVIQNYEKIDSHREQTLGHGEGWGEKERVGQIERVALKHIHYHL